MMEVSWTVIILICYNFAYGHKTESHKLLIISFDGFRWNYLDKVKGKTPNFDKFKKDGAYARQGIKNVFTTVTVSNHYSLVTGLYPESHGVMGNYIYDPRYNDSYKLYDMAQQYESKWFDDGGEPIWVTNQLQDNEHRSGSIFWPGSGAAVDGVMPIRLQPGLPFDTSVTNKTRIDSMIKWFTEEYPINLGLLYFEEPDEVGHHFGPDSEQIKNVIIGLDKELGYLLEQVEKHKLQHDLDIILTADHGMATISNNKTINLDEFVDPNLYQVFGVSPVINILPNEGEIENIYNKLQEAAKINEHFRVYKKKDIPTEYHYKNNIRVPPIIVIADEHYSLLYNGTQNITNKGTHGFDNNLSDMHPIFMAMGPSFKKGGIVETFNIVDIYPLMCHILGLRPAVNNGTLDVVKELLKEGGQYTIVTFGTYIGILLFIGLVGGVFTMAACRQHRNLKRKQRQMSVPGGVQFSTMLQRESKLPLLSESEEESTP